jgi:hypothetical protein
MRPQTRPFTVEVKKKRTTYKRSGSIWGDLDLTAVVAEAGTDSQETALPNHNLIDSKITPIDAENTFKPRAEHLMIDLKEAESAQTQNATSATGETVVTKKNAPRSKTTKIQSKRSPRATVATAPAPVSSSAAVRRKYSNTERAQLLGQIEKAVGRGESIKGAIKHAGISEQTYYHWKKSKAPASANSDLKDLLALEEENSRLKKLLAERLRSENAELKKKLGLA